MIALNPTVGSVSGVSVRSLSVTPSALETVGGGDGRTEQRQEAVEEPMFWIR
jgi:hypothetical protein